MNNARVAGQSRRVNRTDSRVEREENIMKTVKTDIPLGDGKAQVGNTRGFKRWMSTRNEGVTVETTITVTLTCGQTLNEIHTAIDKAGQIAEDEVLEAMDRMGIHFKNFQRENE